MVSGMGMAQWMLCRFAFDLKGCINLVQQQNALPFMLTLISFPLGFDTLVQNNNHI